jgi:N-acetylglucosaminyldiphosphoundecaprenol N-acetyl-beta-D-mannosaminyltransferase
MSKHKRINFLNCPVDQINFQQAINECITWCQQDKKTHTIITINASILTMMQDDPELFNVSSKGDLILADGMSVVVATKLSGTPLPERIAGVDLMEHLLIKASEQQLRVYFLGAKEEIVTNLIEKCKIKHPGMTVAGYRNGYFDESQHNNIVIDIRKSNADFLFVGMPSPFKEVWCEKHRDLLNVPVIMGVGGSFDVLAGFIQRAPLWMQKMGLEWFWRLLMEPKKMWKRYLTTNTFFIWLSLKWAFKQRVKRS